MDLFHILTDENRSLSKLDAKLTEFVLRNVDIVVQSSINELAEHTGVSPPTITRFCRRLGCSGFSDFKVQLARMTFVGLRYLQPEMPTTNATEVAEDITTKAQSALFKLHNQLDIEAIENATRLISAAEFIYTIGAGGNSSMIVNEIQNRLFRLGCHVQTTNDKSLAIMLAAAATPGTVGIISSMSGRDPELVHCVDLFNQNDIPTIALTQSGSPIAERATVVVAIDLSEGKNIYRPTSTRYAYLAAIDIIANLVAYTNRKKSTQTLRRIKEELVKHRDSDDRQLLGD